MGGGGQVNLNQVGAQLGAPNEFSSLGLSISQPKRGVAPHRVPRASLSWQGLTDAVTFIHRFARALTWHLAPGYPSRRTCGAGPVVRGACVVIVSAKRGTAGLVTGARSVAVPGPNRRQSMHRAEARLTARLPKSPDTPTPRSSPEPRPRTHVCTPRNGSPSIPKPGRGENR